MSASSHWSRFVVPIALLYTCRMLGLFLLIPVFTLFAHELQGATPALMGIALGAYGLSQACMQIPFGVLSDYIGRKPMIAIGLGLLIIGSLIGAYTHTIYGMIFARTLQGAGAIGSVLLALLSDLVPLNHRAKAMAIIGMSIGLSFSAAMILGPLLAQHYGLPSLFYFTAGLASLGLGIVAYVIPTVSDPQPRSPFQFKLLRNHVMNYELQRLNMGIFIQHAILTATFYALPLQLRVFINQGILTTSWHFYMPIVLLSFICMLPIVVIAEKKQQIMPVLKYAVFLLAISQALLIYYSSNWFMLIGLVLLYFIAFNLAEAFLPSQVSKQASATQRGTAMGIYSTYQFLGIFSGGAAAGLIYSHWHQDGVYVLNALMGLVWFVLFRTNEKKSRPTS